MKMENRSSTVERGRSIIGSLVKRSPHFALAFELIVLTCSEKESCVENPNPR